MGADRDRALRRRIEQIKGQVAALGPLRPGTLTQQYNVCGTPGCRCKADPPEKHGPYYQLSYTWRGHSRSESVLAREVERVREQLRNYQRLRALLDDWVTAGIEVARLERLAVRHPQEKSRATTRTAAKRRPARAKTAPPRSR
jgi:hypothetical protein